MKILAVLLFLLPLTAVSQSLDSYVKFDTKTIDLGKVQRGAKVAGSFVFTNISTEIVEIDMVSTCECTEASWTKGIIKPGEKGRIDFIFDSAQKDKEEKVDIDVFFTNVDPVNGSQITAFLKYTYSFE